MRVVSIAAAAATVVGICLAESQSLAGGRTEEIVVTASPLGDVLQPSEVVSGDELLLNAAPTLGETLANQLGVSSSYFGPASSRPIIRGLAGSRVKMLSDSVATLDVSDVSPDHAVAVETLLADQIEIIRGPATLLYGSSAAGGVINVSDSRIPAAPAEKLLSGRIQFRGATAPEGRTFVGRPDGSVGTVAGPVAGFAPRTPYG